MDKKVDVVIIGAGSAGLSAFKEANKYTKNILVIDKGPLGSTCARVGCMPSKTLIQVANYFHDRQNFARQGIRGAEKLTVSMPDVLSYVRTLRDKFTEGVIAFTKSLGDQFLCGEARFINPDTLQVGRLKISSKATIIATGSQSFIPDEWLEFKDRILTSESIFEQNDLASDIAVIGAGSIGLEFGQALARLGVNISAYHNGQFIGGLSDPKVNEVAIKIFNDEFPLYLKKEVSLTEKFPAAQVIASIGRKPNIDSLGLKALGIPFDSTGIPVFDKTTMQIQGFPIYIAGDVNKIRPLLHEAADEGRIAGYNATNKSQGFQRRTPVRIIFTEPNIAVVGSAFHALEENTYVTGEVDFSDQGRAKIKHHNKGLLRVYGSKKSGELLGAELIAPGGEHLAHLLAWAIQQKLTAFDVLQMPFYHPVIEEGLRTALRQLTNQVECKLKPFELTMCDSEAIHCLS